MKAPLNKKHRSFWLTAVFDFRTTGISVQIVDMILFVAVAMITVHFILVFQIQIYNYLLPVKIYVLPILKTDQGEYIPLSRLRKQDLEHILQSHRLFLKQRCLSPNQTWKEGRAIWHDRRNHLLIVINEDEHIKIICQQFGGDLLQLFRKLRGLLLELENLLTEAGYEFMRNDHYGYLASRPQDLGSSLRVSVNVKLPLTAKVRRAA